MVIPQARAMELSLAACPSDVELELYLLGAGRSPVASHVRRCFRCRAELRLMAEEGEHFRRFVYPATAPAIWKAAERLGGCPAFGGRGERR